MNLTVRISFATRRFSWFSLEGFFEPLFFRALFPSVLQQAMASVGKSKYRSDTSACNTWEFLVSGLGVLVLSLDVVACEGNGV